MAKHIESKKGLQTLLKRVKDYGRKAIKEKGFNLDEFIYWRKCIVATPLFIQLKNTSHSSNPENKKTRTRSLS